jgi:hypothetical protein
MSSRRHAAGFSATDTKVNASALACQILRFKSFFFFSGPKGHTLPAGVAKHDRVLVWTEPRRQIVGDPVLKPHDVRWIRMLLHSYPQVMGVMVRKIADRSYELIVRPTPSLAHGQHVPLSCCHLKLWVKRREQKLWVKRREHQGEAIRHLAQDGPKR